MLVLGQTAKQGTIAWRPGMTTGLCFARMGGCSQFADLRRVSLVTTTGRSLWQGEPMQERVIDLRPGKPDVEVPDQSVLIVPEKKLTF